MPVDEPVLHELLEHSDDLHADAMRSQRSALSDVADYAHDTRDDEVDPEQVAAFDDSRRSLVDNLGLSDGFVRKGLLAGGLGVFVAAVLATPAAADKSLDQQILQTARSLEILAVATYGAALKLPFIKNGNMVVKTFARRRRSNTASTTRRSRRNSRRSAASSRTSRTRSTSRS